MNHYMLLIVLISNNGTSIVLEVLSLMKISLKKGEIEKKFQKLGRAQHTIKLYAHTSGYGLTIAAARVRTLLPRDFEKNLYFDGVLMCCECTFIMEHVRGYIKNIHIRIYLLYIHRYCC